jgi:glycine/D-amino acid oxidase-like deaminating enzyme
MERAEVVIVGGGVIGASVAFHLAEEGVDVLLLERGELGSGSTSKGAGGVRAMFSDELNVRIGVRSLDAWAAFGERPGAEVDFRRSGYLFLLSGGLEGWRAAVAMQNEHGAPSRLIDPGEAAQLSPLAQLDGIVAAAYCPLAGLVTPDAAVQGYAAGVRTHDGRVATGRAVTGIDMTRGAVQTTAGEVAAGAIVCAAGAWSAAVGELAGVPLDVTPERRRIAYTGPMEDLPDELPMTIDFDTGFYFHREGPGLLFGTADVTDTQDEWLERAAPILARRAPALTDAPIAGGWSGLYEMTPDHNALIGEAPGTPTRFLYATGFSGHGFQQAPVVGAIVRDLYLGRTPPIDPAPLSAERDLRPERNVV